LSTESEYDKEELPFSQVDEVLFELSNADRLSIPTKLNKEEEKEESRSARR